MDVCPDEGIKQTTNLAYVASVTLMVQVPPDGAVNAPLASAPSTIRIVAPLDCAVAVSGKVKVPEVDPQAYEPDW